METAGTSGSTLIFLAIITLVGTLGTAYFAYKSTRSSRERRDQAVATSAAETTAEAAAMQLDSLLVRRTQELHDRYNAELARLAAELERKDARIAQLEGRLDG